MSKTTAANPVCKDGEGVTRVLLENGAIVGLDALAALAPTELFGEYVDRWPLTKVQPSPVFLWQFVNLSHCFIVFALVQILDIGGKAVRPSFAPDEPEVPPIPCHVHNGVVIDGKMVGPGKVEAYFFPPLDVPPYNMKLSGVFSRLGVRPDVSRDKVLAAMEEFGATDTLYSLLTR